MFLVLLLTGKIVFWIVEWDQVRDGGGSDEVLRFLLLEACPCLMGALVSAIIPFTQTRTIKLLILTAVYSATIIFVSYSQSTSPYFLISKSLKNLLFFILFLRYVSRLSFIHKSESLYILKETHCQLFASNLVFLCSLSTLLAVLYTSFLFSPKTARLSSVFYSIALATSSVGFYLLYKTPASNANILETEPAENINTEKSLPDMCKSFTNTLPMKDAEDLNLSVNEKSVQEFEYNYVGISCGYYLDEEILRKRNEEPNNYEKSYNRTYLRRSNSFGDIIVEQLNEDSSNDHLETESKVSSTHKARRNSEGSKSGGSKQSSLCSDDFSFHRSVDSSKESIANLP